jgi:two-component system NtrC family sensor kinase
MVHASERAQILVVDDEATIAQLIVDVLASDGYAIDTAPNGIVALERIAGKAYDLILSDLRMPEMDGLALYHELERERPDLLRRFVFITGTSEHPDYRGFMEHAKVPVLTKPFDMFELQRVVRETLSLR